MDPLKDQPQITTTTICPTRSVLTVPDGPGRRIEIDDDAPHDLDLSCELATTALLMNGRARPASPDPGRRTVARMGPRSLRSAVRWLQA